MSNQLRTNTVTLSSAAASTPVLFNPVFYPGSLQPAFLAILSSGASMTYNIEVTGDDPPSPTGNWLPFTDMSALTASAAGTLGAVVMGVRARITTYGSGTLTFQFIQQSAT